MNMPRKKKEQRKWEKPDLNFSEMYFTNYVLEVHVP